VKHSRPAFVNYAPVVAILVLGIASSFALSATSSSLKAKERLQVFEEIWKSIDRYYYDPDFGGVNWRDVHQSYLPKVRAVSDDKEFYSLMSSMTAELHDAHTRFFSPTQWEDLNKYQATSLGFRAGFVEESVVILDVTADSNAARAGVTPGMVVRAVNGKPIENALREAAGKVLRSSSQRLTRLLVLAAAFSAPPETTLDISLERADGSVLETKIARQVISRPPKVSSAQLPSGFGYIRFDGFQQNLNSEFKTALEDLRQMPGVVLDLRQNGGGVLTDTMPGFFFNQKTLFGIFMPRKQVGAFKRNGRTQGNQLYAGRSDGQIYSGPVVILISEYSGSVAEIFAAGMQDSGRATIVGSQSCGCVLGLGKSRVMKGGGVLQISELLWLSPKKRKLEGEGVIPDVAIAPTVASLLEGRDIVLEAGEKILRELSTARPSSR